MTRLKWFLACREYLKVTRLKWFVALLYVCSMEILANHEKGRNFTTAFITKSFLEKQKMCSSGGLLDKTTELDPRLLITVGTCM